MDFSEKHVIVISDVDKFFYLYADSLANKCGVDADKIVALVYKSGRKETLKKQVSFRYCYYSDSILRDLSVAKTITFMSLLSWNAPIFKKLVEIDSSNLDKLYINTTDDEVARWKKNHQTFGRLKKDLKAYISEADLFVLSKVKHFIAPKYYFKATLEKILARTDFKVHNASVIFDILPVYQSEQLRSELRPFKKASVPNVLIGTKKAKLKRVLSFLNRLDKQSYPIHINLIALSAAKRWVLNRYLFFLRRVLGLHVTVEYLSTMPAVDYNTMVASCSHLVLQDRGGASTARVFLKWGAGQIVVDKGSPNGLIFANVFGVNFIDFSYPINLETNSSKDIHFIDTNTQAVEAEETRSVKKLKVLYSSF